MIYYVIAFAAGLGITLQTTLNSQLAKGLGGDPVTAALFSFTAGAFSLGIYALLRGGLITSLSAIPSQPLWSLAGGLIGACALFSYVVLAPKIGFSALLGLAIVGQLLSSQMFDHFGLLGLCVGRFRYSGWGDWLSCWPDSPSCFSASGSQHVFCSNGVTHLCRRTVKP